MTEFPSVAIMEQKAITDVEINNDVKISRKISGKNIIGFMLYVSLLAGVGVGAYFSMSGGNELYKQLDFLFSSNINVKLHQSFFNTFLSSYASSCIFLVAAFLLGSSLWGGLMQFALSFFKGFGVGLSAAYLFHTYQLNGAVYYAGVMLPCVFISVLALISLQKESFVFSGRLVSAVYKREEMSHFLLHGRFNSYFKKFISSLIITLFSALLDVGLTWLFGSSFHF